MYPFRPISMIGAVCLPLLLAASTTSVAEAPVIPQTGETVVLSSVEAQKLRVYLGRRLKIQLLPLEVQRMLLTGAPRGFREACDAMVNSWGAPAHGTALPSVRLLGRTSPDEVWLAFRCGSRLRDLRAYYSERLALLTPARALIRFFDLGSESIGKISSPLLYRVKLGEAIKLPRTDAASFLIYADSESPPSRGPPGVTEERFLVIAGKSAEMRQVLSIMTIHRHHESAIDTIYRARLGFKRDATGRVTAISVYFHESLNGRLRRAGMLLYKWNPLSETFEAGPSKRR
jgi:hypothetical protein